MPDTVRNERAALSLYFSKHFIADPPIDQQWFRTEQNALNDMVNHDPTPYSYIESEERAERFAFHRYDHYQTPHQSLRINHASTSRTTGHPSPD